jgi:23S rRNA (guanine2445-N2)-methyltransferase / 23S rRNA (guanine2069-N7)-methyltransferase
LFNGAIPCQLLLFDIIPEKFLDRSPAAVNERRIVAAQRAVADSDKSAVDMFVNRLRKNLKHIKRWAEREGIACYRIYDADLPEYAFAVDCYEQFIYVQEYQAPKTVDKTKALQRQQEVLAVLPDALNVPAAQIFFQIKHKRAASLSPDAMVNLDNFYQVHEHGARFLVNLQQTGIETGLILQQRLLREKIKLRADGAHFLNLFATSGAMTVCAAQGGALTTKSVAETPFDFSWINRNLAINNITGAQHQVITTDPLMWFDREKTHYHLIFANLPNIEPEDYELVLYQMLKLLLPDGVLLIASSDRRFKPDPLWCPDFKMEDITQQMMPVDFPRNATGERYWLIS